MRFYGRLKTYRSLTVTDRYNQRVQYMTHVSWLSATRMLGTVAVQCSREPFLTVVSYWCIQYVQKLTGSQSFLTHNLGSALSFLPSKRQLSINTVAHCLTLGLCNFRLILKDHTHVERHGITL